MEHGIIAPTKGIGIRTRHSRNLFPLLRFDVGRDVECTSVADDEHGLGAYLGQTHELILQRQLRLQDGPFATIVERTVGRQVVPARRTIERRNLWDGEYLIPHPREIFDDLHQCCGLTSTGTTGQYDLLDFRHTLDTQFIKHSDQFLIEGLVGTDALGERHIDHLVVTHTHHHVALTLQDSLDGTHAGAAGQDTVVSRG